MASAHAVHPLGTSDAAAYTPINISFLGQQNGIPELSYWRNNLVALSKRYNYIFLALRSSIYVFVPSYPTQSFPENPHCILQSESSGPFSGYIDVRNPHAINSLTIGDLGLEEVLVSAHDDGDICLWYTRDLSRVALRWNVGGHSAWGVALHKERRLLAVSANSHLIHVFDLGLGEHERCTKKAKKANDGTRERNVNAGRQASELEQLAALDSGDPYTLAETSAPFLEKRTVKVLKGHDNNIPSISFLNDPSGNWLVGTSIDGKVIVWDIEREEPVDEIRLPDTERGWSVLFLTPECFLPTHDFRDGTGASPNSRNDIPYDISPPQGRTRSRIGSRFNIMYGNNRYLTESTDSESGDIDFYDSSSDDEPVLNLQHDLSEIESSGDYSMDEGGDEDAESDEDRAEDNMLYTAQPPATTQSIPRSTATTLQPQSEERQQQASAPNDVERSQKAGDATATTSYDNEETENPVPPRSFVFSTSEHTVQLFEVPELEPLVVCSHVLFSEITRSTLRYMDGIEGLMDRLNMACLIPELSTVVAATQKGRVAVFRLTQNEDGFMMRLDDMLPREPGDMLHRPNISNDEPQTRPRAPLLGIAAGPIQGREFGKSRSNSDDSDFASDEDSEGERGIGDQCHGAANGGIRIGWRRKRRRGLWRGVEKRRRHRLIMVYTDGTVLSYELGGSPETNFSGISALDGGYLMV